MITFNETIPVKQDQDSFFKEFSAHCVFFLLFLILLVLLFNNNLFFLKSTEWSRRKRGNKKRFWIYNVRQKEERECAKTKQKNNLDWNDMEWNEIQLPFSWNQRCDYVLACIQIARCNCISMYWNTISIDSVYL